MWHINPANGNIRMNAGDTGAFNVSSSRETGAAWTSNDRAMLTITNAAGAVMLQRYYRLDTELGNGKYHVEFHNNDTDTWTPGDYIVERQYWVNPTWTGTAPTADVVDALAEGVPRMIEGDVRRIPGDEERVTGQSTLTILRTYGGE